MNIYLIYLNIWHSIIYTIIHSFTLVLEFTKTSAVPRNLYMTFVVIIFLWNLIFTPTPIRLSSCVTSLVYFVEDEIIFRMIFTVVVIALPNRSFEVENIRETNKNLTTLFA